MIKYLEKTGEINFDKIFNQRLGFNLLITIRPEFAAALGANVVGFQKNSVWSAFGEVVQVGGLGAGSQKTRQHMILLRTQTAATVRVG